MSYDAVKAGLTRRMNTVFAALELLEWSREDGACPLCGAYQYEGHKYISAGSVGPDAYTQPCPIGFALSEEASAEQNTKSVALETLGDGSRFMRYLQWQRTGTTSSGRQTSDGETK